jgi:hypothetical protein
LSLTGHDGAPFIFRPFQTSTSAEMPIPTPDLDGLGMPNNGNVTEDRQISLIFWAALSAASGGWGWCGLRRRRLRVGLISTTTTRSQISSIGPAVESLERDETEATSRSSLRFGYNVPIA